MPQNATDKPQHETQERIMNLTGTEADYSEYVQTHLLETQLSFVWLVSLVSNASETHDSELEHYGQVFDPDRTKVFDLAEPWDAFRAAHFEIQDGKRNLKCQTHANAEVHFQHYQWLQTLEGMNGEQIKAEFECIKAAEKENSERLYNAEVNSLLATYKDTFSRRLRNAKDPAFTIAEEVKRWEFIVEPEKSADSSAPIGGRHKQLRDAATNVRIGNRQPSIVRKPEHKWQHPQQEAEARLEYLDWLRELQQNHKPEMKADRAWALSLENEPVKEHPQAEGLRKLQSVVEYFNEKGAEVQLLKTGNDHFLQRLEVDLFSLEVHTLSGIKAECELETPILIQSQKRKGASRSELNSLVAHLFAKAKETGDITADCTLTEFAATERTHVKELWGEHSKAFHIAQQWKNHLKAISEGREQPEPHAEPSASSQGKEGGTGAENRLLSYPEVALILAYERLRVTNKAEAKEHGAKYGRITSLSSDLQLLDACIPVYSQEERLAPLQVVQNARKVRSLKRMLDKIEPHLSAKAKPLLEQELHKVNEYLSKLNKRTL